MMSCEAGPVAAGMATAPPALSETGLRMKNLERSGWGDSTEHPAATIMHAPNAIALVLIFVTIIFPCPAGTFRGSARLGCAADSRRTLRGNVRSRSPGRGSG